MSINQGCSENIDISLDQSYTFLFLSGRNPSKLFAIPMCYGSLDIPCPRPQKSTRLKASGLSPRTMLLLSGSRG